MTEFNKDNIIDLTTNSIDLYNGDVRLNISLYNQILTIKIIGVTIVDGKRKFLKDKNVPSIAIPAERIVALNNKLINEFIPAIKNKQECDIYMATNKNGTSIFNIKHDADCNISLSIYTNIDNERKAGTKASYTFTKVTPFNTYNPDTGDFELGNEIQSQFLLFMCIFENYGFAHSMVQSHFNKYSVRYDNNTIMNLLKGIATKVGVQVYENNTGASYMHNNFNNPTPTINEVGSIDSMFGNPDEVPF